MENNKGWTVKRILSWVLVFVLGASFPFLLIGGAMLTGIDPDGDALQVLMGVAWFPAEALLYLTRYEPLNDGVGAAILVIVFVVPFSCFTWGVIFVGMYELMKIMKRKKKRAREYT